MAKITVYIADPIAIFREGIYVALASEEDIEVVGATGVIEEAERFIKAHSPNIAILHINGSKPSGLEITHRIKLELCTVQVILILDNEDDEHIFLAVKSGASVCISRGIDPDHLVSAIKEVAKGAKPISQALLRSTIAARILDEFVTFSLISQEDRDILTGLTTTEADILRRASEGTTAIQLTTTLDLTQETLDVQLALILSKLVGNELRRESIVAVKRV